jgi:hypothetical protein
MVLRIYPFTHFTPFTHTATLNMQPRERTTTLFAQRAATVVAAWSGGGGFYHPRQIGPNDQDINHYDSTLNPKTITGLKTLTLVTGKKSGELFVQVIRGVQQAVDILMAFRHIYISEPCPKGSSSNRYAIL